MPDINAMRRSDTYESLLRIDTYEKMIHDTVILTMAKMVTKEFDPAYVFANNRNWKRGAWETESGEADVVIGNIEERKIVAVYEVEYYSMNVEEVKSRLANRGYPHVEVIVPKSKLEHAKSEIGKLPSVKGFWIYFVDRTGKVIIKRDPENNSKILQQTGTSDAIWV